MFLFPGANELAVQKAKTEITRLIKEELIRLVSIFSLLISVTRCGYHADIRLNRSRKHKTWQVVIQQISMKDVAYCLFFSSFFPPAKFIPADEQRPVQSVVEEESRLAGGVSISQQFPVISTVSSKWLKNILVYIFNNVPFNYLRCCFNFFFVSSVSFR